MLGGGSVTKGASTKYDSLSSIPRIHISGEKNQLLHIAFWPHMFCDTYVYL